MQSLETALSAVLQSVPPPEGEVVSLRHACGRHVVRCTGSSMAIPPFDNSAMDGFALHSGDTVNASPGQGVCLVVVGESAAGKPFAGSCPPGCAVRISTGAMLPDSCDAVVMQEDVICGPDGRIRISERIRPWESVRLRGEDTEAGAILAEPGERLTPARIGWMAAAGLSAVEAGRRPRLHLIPTGSELVAPGKMILQPGQIFESNTVMLEALFRNWGAEITIHPPIPDRLDDTIQFLETCAADADAMITLGAASVGPHDHVREAFERMDARIDFWRISMKPGKPFFFGHRRKSMVFGLPGNPVSALVTARLLVCPAIARFQGATVADPARHAGILGEALSNPDSRRHFVRVRRNDKGDWISTGPQASHRLATAAPAEGLVDVPPGSSLEKGLRVEIVGWNPA